MMKHTLALPQSLKRGFKPTRAQLRRARTGPWAGLVDAAWLGGFDFVEGTHKIEPQGTTPPVVEPPGLTFDASGSNTRAYITPKLSWTDTVEGNFTVAFRFMPGAVSATIRGMVAFGAGGALTPLFYLRHTSTYLETIYDCDSGTQQSSQWSHGGAWTVNTWYNIVMTFDWSGDAVVYIDGVERIRDTITGNLSGTIGAGSGDFSALGGFNNTGTNWTQNCNGHFDSLYIFNTALNEEQCRALCMDWYSPVEWYSPDLRTIESVGGDVTQAIGIASETDSALAMTAIVGHVGTIGIASETDSALAMTGIIGASAAIGIASETDSALAMTGIIGASAAIGIASETDSALAVTAVVGYTSAIGIPSETDSALAMTAAVGHTSAIGIPSETDSALAVKESLGGPIGIASETDSALAMTALVGPTSALGIASETDTALAMTVHADLFGSLGIASETDTALPIIYDSGIIGKTTSVDVNMLQTTLIRVDALETTVINLNVEIDTEISMRVDV